ncbi:OLC1v1011712C1 [Oldenlandia corymbosa var. corymbosa]|uniref:OLC1v1011712C1 n=1 Tax=Oldenlandia corymbosa var. corymbosa TaxID=529605 RepID=A0AAV1DUV7_OLDCO|nr:OLC1v1011712C1 [Oldenlandia corymbosa var. corymbosa]
MNTSQFMDKQIMDLSNSHSNINTPNTNNSDFLDLINPPAADRHHHIGGGEGDSDKKEEILPSYDFQPIRLVVGSSSPPSSKLDSSRTGASPRAWNSADNNKSNAGGIRNYSSFESYEPSRFTLEKDQSGIDPTLVSEIDRTMKKYADNLMHGLDSVSARLSQLESRTRHLENSLDELKVSVGTNHGSSDGRMRQLENILREVQDGVQTIKDKQEIMDARLTLSKLQVSKVEQQADIPTPEHVVSLQVGVTSGQHSQQQLPPVPLTHPPSVPPPNAPPPPASQQNMPPHVPLPGHFPPNQVPPEPQRESYFAPPPPPPPGQTPENPGQQYQMPPGQQLQASSQPQPQPQHQYQSLPQLPYPQPPTPPPPHASLPPVNLSQPQPSITHHHPEESPYAQSQNYPPNVRQTPPPPPPPNAAPPHQQFYGGPSNMYEPPANRPGPGFPGSFGPSGGSTEQYPYGGSTSQYGGNSLVKPQQMSSPAMSHGSGGSAYPQLPTARILPQAVPTASAVGSGPGSPVSGNRVPIDDVVDKVTNMGFSRDQVRATVRKLTENGQAVDLNVVLDKLMNDGDVQPPRGWFGR